MSATATIRLYLDDSHCCEAEAAVVAVVDDAFACDRSCFYPGGGGQPADEGVAELPDGRALAIVSARADDTGVLWHVTASSPPPSLAGATV